MTGKPQKIKKSRGVLMLVGGLLFVSAVFRLGDTAGQAFARESAPVEPPAAEGEVLAEPTGDRVFDALVRDLREREKRVAEQEAQLEARLAQLQDIESKVSAQLIELEAAEEALRDTLALADGAAEQDIARLVAVYENMKPKDAAQLFQAMEPNFAAGFLGRMKPAAAAEIMAGLTPDIAYSISVELAGRNASVPRE